MVVVVGVAREGSISEREFILRVRERDFMLVKGTWKGDGGLFLLIFIACL